MTKGDQPMTDATPEHTPRTNPPADEDTYRPPATKAELDRLIETELRNDREKRGYAQLKAKADAHDRHVEASKTELQRVTDRAAKAEAQLAEAQAALLRAEVAQTKGLDPALAKRLVGTTREQLEADADELLRAVKPKAVGIRAVTPADDTNRTTPEDTAKAFFGLS